MEPTQVIAVRHGRTAWNASQRVQGHQDVALDAVGTWQASQVAKALADTPLHAVHSSDLRRAHATALAIAGLHALPVRAHPALRERHFGRFETLTHAEIEARWPEEALRWRRRDPVFTPGGGESLLAFSARCVAAVERLAEAHRGQTIVIVAHGGVLDCLYRAAVGLPLEAPRSWALGNATINRLLYTGEGLQMVGWNDDGHLAGEAPAEA
ncbi:histidine phosphatase family protein [Rubrivivax rivuli]|uniref:Histidine phosphatase family protein n=1 Tax=Rubrivivax rivuli TaxID=1862385 RepID=A0A437RSW1_9BURK|nr:histidine phosphatase family protein [Rubrivivax rivuli]